MWLAHLLLDSSLTVSLAELSFFWDSCVVGVLGVAGEEGIEERIPSYVISFLLFSLRFVS